MAPGARIGFGAPFSNLRSFRSKSTELKKVHATLLGHFRAPCSQSASPAVIRCPHVIRRPCNCSPFAPSLSRWSLHQLTWTVNKPNYYHGIAWWQPSALPVSLRPNGYPGELLSVWHCSSTRAFRKPQLWSTVCPLSAYGSSIYSER